MIRAPRPKKSKPKSPASGKTPQGRDAVKAAILGSAEQLFAERGYAGVSVRDIAAHAKVNHGLVHRHFGAKEDLMREVLLSMFSDVGARAREVLSSKGDDEFIPFLFETAAKRKRHWVILMRAVLDGYDFDAVGFQWPITQTLVGHIAKRRGKNDEEGRAMAGAVIAGGLGWLLLEDYLTRAVGLPRNKVEALRADMAKRFATLIKP